MILFQFGPRALGHRSLICYPNKAELKNVINKLKSREWFRPLCPAVTVKCAAKLFEGTISKPNVQYDHGKMSFSLIFVFVFYLYSLITMPLYKRPPSFCNQKMLLKRQTSLEMSTTSKLIISLHCNPDRKFDDYQKNIIFAYFIKLFASEYSNICDPT